MAAASGSRGRSSSGFAASTSPEVVCILREFGPQASRRPAILYLARTNTRLKGKPCVPWVGAAAGPLGWGRAARRQADGFGRVGPGAPGPWAAGVQRCNPAIGCRSILLSESKSKSKFLLHVLRAKSRTLACFVCVTRSLLASALSRAYSESGSQRLSVPSQGAHGRVPLVRPRRPTGDADARHQVARRVAWVPHARIP
jgi:hypothetical protein